MIDNLPHVPPALILLLREMALVDSWRDARRRVKGMLRDLRDQSEVYESQQSRQSVKEESTGQFDVHLHGAMNLLTRQGCGALECRTAAADRIARSVGLIADRVWLTDTLTEKFVDFGRVTNEKLDEVMEDAIVLSRVMPLILAGIVKFRSPWIATCSSCRDYFYSQIESASQDLAKTFFSEFKFDKTSDGGFTFDTGAATEPSLFFKGYRQKGEKIPSKKKFVEGWVEQQLYSIYWVAREAAITGGTIVSNSRLGLAGLLQQEGRLFDASSLYLLDKEREISVPWVSKLDAQQIVELRQEASLALPLLREKLFHVMSSSGASKVNQDTSKDWLFELREQAEEVRSELKTAQRSSARFWKVTYGVLGLGLSAYGIATDQVLAGVGGLLPILQLLMSHKSGHEAAVTSAISKPGYVLVKAQDILSHAHE